MAYSKDLRQRVIEFIKEGEGSPPQAAQLFKIGRATIYRWLNRSELISSKPGPKGPRKINLKALQQAVEEKPDSYLAELAERFKVSLNTISYTLKKMNLSRKKNHALRREKRKRAQTV